MLLQYLLKYLPADSKIFGSSKISVKKITDDSRWVAKNDLFVAIRGLRTDAHQFIPEVIKKGAIAIAAEDEPNSEWLEKVTYIKVGNSRKALGILASAWFGNPSSKLKVVGVTGTDGKTTTCYLIYYFLKSSGKKVGLITTVSARIGAKEIDTGLHVTNPHPISLQNLLYQMLKQKCEYAVVEVTSHGIDQQRIAGTSFDSAVLTNITSEHLDYHKTYEAYRDTKAKLFQMAKSFVVLNKDDKSYSLISSILPKAVKRIYYALEDLNSDICAKDIKEQNEHTSFQTIIRGKKILMNSPLLGKYNVMNVLAAMAVALEYGVSLDDIKKALIRFTAPPGRLEKVANDKAIEIYIDFAHTPNSLEKVLSLLRKRLEKRKKEGKLIAVFGCAGERDWQKRPKMARISTKIADISIFTAEDPRSEAVEAILKQMEKGVKGQNDVKKIDFRNYSENLRSVKKNKVGYRKRVYFEIPERGEAIAFALQKLAKRGDIVVICGKGHERSMAYDGIEYPWSDYEAVKMALQGRVKRVIESCSQI